MLSYYITKYSVNLKTTIDGKPNILLLSDGKPNILLLSDGKPYDNFKSSDLLKYHLYFSIFDEVHNIYNQLKNS